MDNNKQYAFLVELIANTRVLLAYSDSKKISDIAHQIKNLGFDIANELGRNKQELDSDTVCRYDELRKEKCTETMDINKAVQILRGNNFSNRMILSNLDRELFDFEEDEVNKALEFLQTSTVNFGDSDYDELVKYLYKVPSQNV